MSEVQSRHFHSPEFKAKVARRLIERPSPLARVRSAKRRTMVRSATPWTFQAKVEINLEEDLFVLVLSASRSTKNGAQHTA
jgi:hypothetical protein